MVLCVPGGRNFCSIERRIPMATNWQLTPAQGQLARSARLACHNPLPEVGGALVAVFLFCALFAPWIAPQDPAHIDLPKPARIAFAASSLWTDELGRDILSRREAFLMGRRGVLVAESFGAAFAQGCIYV